ncbi:cyclase family protein [Kaistia adipata]|uniref:cyclase family protein n=1 Tax=Kaistia adipata TaxID=166954 RepID=UPI0003F682D1|nr:cyclase family protein [Kaistia adipata]
MGQLTDITGKLEPGMWDYRVFPGFEDLVPPLRIETMGTLDTFGFYGSKFTLSSISGTYLEASSHVLADGRHLSSYGVDDFIRPAKILRLGGLAPDTLIDGAMLAAAAPAIEPGDALLIDTGWYRQWNTPGFVERCPKMLPSALAWILEQPIALLGVDIPAIEAAWTDDDASAKGGLLTQLFARGTLLLAPVVNLDQIGADRGRLYALPLPVVGTSGAPVRAILEWE